MMDKGKQSENDQTEKCIETQLSITNATANITAAVLTAKCTMQAVLVSVAPAKVYVRGLHANILIVSRRMKTTK